MGSKYNVVLFSSFGADKSIPSNNWLKCKFMILGYWLIGKRIVWMEKN